MGKKYLDTKEGSLEQSVLGVWQTAIEEGETRVDGRTKQYKEHRAKLETARLRREKKKQVTEASGDKEAYQKFFNATLKKFGVKSPAELKDKDKKKFYDMIDAGWEGDNEKKEEVELDEKPADFIRLSFSSPADVKKAKKWMDQNLPGANQGFTGMDASGKDIEFEGVDDAEDLMAKLKKAGFKFKMDYREETDYQQFKVQSMKEALAKVWGLDEAKADFIRLTFNSPADVKKAKKWMDQNLPGADQGFTGMDASGKDIEFEGVDDAEDLMAKLKKAGFKFKMDYREEVEVDEGKMSQLHQLMKDGKTAEEIAKIMRVDAKTIKKLMAGYNESYEIGTDGYRKHTENVTPGEDGEWVAAQKSKNDSMREALAKVWNATEDKNPFKKDLTKEVKNGKTMTGKKVASVDINPKIMEKKK